MELEKLLSFLKIESKIGNSKAKVSGITHDSRNVHPGFVFVCIHGFQSDGHDYIKEAVRRGAIAIVMEKSIGKSMESDKDSVVLVRVPDSRKALALLSSAFFQHPSKKIRIIGITGTNGKTTTSYLINSILEKAGFTVGLQNTLISSIRGQQNPSVRTTPESIELQKHLSEMVDQKCHYAVIEVSSHALVLHRVLDCEFDIAVLTNITADHLDFHHTMGEYIEAKKRLFSHLHEGEKFRKIAILNLDDPSFSGIKDGVDVKILSYGIKNRGDIWAENATIDQEGMNFTVHTPSGMVYINTDLSGVHNIYNILAAISVGVAEGIDSEKIQQGIESVRKIPGRFEMISAGQPFWTVVDFAHTPDALQNLLETGRQLNPQKIITVFGCGGDRDKQKRLPMGRVAATLSDYLIITNDNVREEDPLEIVGEIEKGVFLAWPSSKNQANKKYEIIPDRYQAIKRAFHLAKEKDLVVIAGKGHEHYQVIGKESIPFDDRRVAKELLKRLN